MLNENKL